MATKFSSGMRVILRRDPNSLGEVEEVSANGQQVLVAWDRTGADGTKRAKMINKTVWHPAAHLKNITRASNSFDIGAWMKRIVR